MDLGLRGKRALITGGSRGIGFVVARALAAEVRPRARGSGVGEALVATVIGWAGQRNAMSVHLWVTETNSHARALYERCGFALTGEWQPLPSDPAIGEIAMSRTLP